MDPINNLFRQWLLWTSAAIALALAGAGHAAEGRIFFSGAVATPTCTLIVGGVGTSANVNGLSTESTTTLVLPAATGSFLNIATADCQDAADAGNMGAAPRVSIYLESVDSGEQESDEIVSIEYE